jgi:hypothetical protein
MRKVWRLSEFRDLKQEWEERLFYDGFVDIEVEKNGTRQLKKFADAPTHDAKMTPEQAEIRADYFSKIEQFVAKETGFEDESDRLIMERTAAGCLIWEISKELREKNLKKSNRDTIRYIRRRYEMRWGIRHWRPEEMVSRKPKMPKS